LIRFLPTTAFAIVAWLAATASARAESRLLVLSAVGVPTSGDAAELDASILTSARSDVRFRVFDRVVRRDSAQRDARCTSFDDSCLLRIATRRDADRILYGAVTPSTDDPERSDITLHVFDRYTGRTRESLVGSIETDALDSQRELRHLAEKLVPFVLRVPEEGSAIVRADVGASVEIDGRAMGTVPASGELELRPLAVGRRVLRIERPNHPAWEAPIVIRARDTIRITVGTGSAALEASATSRHAAPSDGTIEPPPEWVLAIPGDEPTIESAGVFTVGIGLSRVRFTIPVLEEHVARGEIRTEINARVGFLPRVSGSGARFTAKLHF